MADAIDPSRGANLVNIRGKVDAVEENQGTIYTRVILPAPDEYSDTQLVQFRSKSRVAGPGDMIDKVCRIGGYNQTFQRKDGGRGTRNTILLDLVVQ